MVYTCILIVYKGGIYMYIDGVYGLYLHVYWWCIRVVYTCILIVYMGGIYMYNVYWLCIVVVYTCILILYMGGICMYVDCVYGWYIHIYWLCIWVVYTCILIVYMGGRYSILIVSMGWYLWSQNLDLHRHMSRSRLCSIIWGEKWSFVLWFLSFCF